MYYGDVGPGIISLDAQLAVIGNLAGALATMTSLQFDGAVARGTADIPPQFYMHQPMEFGASPMLATWTRDRYSDFTLPYDTPVGVVPIAHRMLVQYQLENGAQTDEGMSGAAVSSGVAGGRFLGMHIGGAVTDGLFIPAWLLLDGSRYGLPPGSRLIPRGAGDLG